MSSGRLMIVSKLEKLKAGLGAAGMTAVGFEAFDVSRLLGIPAASIFANTALVAAATASGIAAWFFTEVSRKEARLELEAAKEGTMATSTGE